MTSTDHHRRRPVADPQWGARGRSPPGRSKPIFTTQFPTGYIANLLIFISLPVFTRLGLHQCILIPLKIEMLVISTPPRQILPHVGGVGLSKLKILRNFGINRPAGCIAWAILTKLLQHGKLHAGSATEIWIDSLKGFQSHGV